jgi:FkbM family methyltransferase
LFRGIGIQRCHTPPFLTRKPKLVVPSLLPFVVAYELLKNPHLTFLQIGAFDGAGVDDLRGLIQAHQLRGVLVEPQPIAFARLQHTYRNQPNVMLLQAAIAEQEGMRDFYCVRDAASKVASFDRNHLLKHGVRDDEIITDKVNCHTVSSALRTAGLRAVDVVLIDAEGYDWTIIRSIDFTQWRPRVLRFEFTHMSPKHGDECLALLTSHGYRFIVDARDIVAIQSTEKIVALSSIQPAIA